MLDACSSLASSRTLRGQLFKIKELRYLQVTVTGDQKVMQPYLFRRAKGTSQLLGPVVGWPVERRVTVEAEDNLLVI